MKAKFKLLVFISSVLSLATVIYLHQYSGDSTTPNRAEKLKAALPNEEEIPVKGFKPIKEAATQYVPGEQGETKEQKATSPPQNPGRHRKIKRDPVKFVIDCEKEMPDLEELWRRLVVVTAFSENHVSEAKGMIASVQKHMPEKRIIVYDLGIKNTTRPKVRKFCGVEVRNFNFSRYPPHTANLHTYAWKVFLIREALQEFGAIFWGDASVRFSGSLKVVLPYLHLHHGFMTHIHSYDPKVKSTIKHQYHFTHHKMFDELGVKREDYYKAKNAAPHIAANRQLHINNSVMTEKILEPLTKCALRKECIAPEGSVVNQHRFDASALAILVYKNMRYEWTPENHNTTSDILDRVATTDRITSDAKNVRSC